MAVEKKKEIIIKNNPMALIQQAIEGGSDLDSLQKLLEIQQSWEKNEAKKAYHKSMAEFKKCPPVIEKDRVVKYNNVKYSHATLGNVVDTVSGALSHHGLSASWRTVQNGQIVVTCRITHKDGFHEETSLSAPSDTSGSKNAIQAIGSTVSYLSRYTLLSILGLATSDMDNDGRPEEAEKIDENKVAILKKLIKEVKADEPKFLKFMGIDKIEDMLKKDFIKAKVGLESKRKK